MMDVVEFLDARLNEDERIARRAGDVRSSGTPGAQNWTYHRERFEVSADVPGWSIAAKKIGGHGDPICDVDGEHIARWDPARVLAELKAKRLIIELHTPKSSSSGLYCPTCSDLDLGGDPVGEWPCDTVRYLTMPYAAHSDCDLAWLPLKKEKP